MKRNHPCALLRTRFTIVVASLTGARAADGAPATGTIEGRVSNPANGEYIETARLIVEGAGGETFSDTAGFYRLTNVPAGTVRVKAFFTGLAAQTATVTVTAGQTATLDFSLAALPGRPGRGREGEIVKLSEFTVSTSREMDGAAIATNTPRRTIPTSPAWRCATARKRRPAAPSA